MNAKKITVLDENKNIVNITEYNNDGKPIHFKANRINHEFWYGYDADGRCIYEKSVYDNSSGLTSHERWCEYDDDGKLIHEKDSRGFEYYFKYEY